MFPGILVGNEVHFPDRLNGHRGDEFFRRDFKFCVAAFFDVASRVGDRMHGRDGRGGAGAGAHASAT